MKIVLLLVMACIASAQERPPLNLRGDRFPPLTWETMSPDQVKMAEHILSGGRPTLDGPHNVLLRSPAWADLAQEYGGQMRFLKTMPPKLRELAIILIAREWNSEFEWQAHRVAAAEAGLDESVIRAIAEGRRPELAAEEAVIYNFATELLRTKQVSDATFAAAKKQLGESGVVDLMGLMGWYQLVAMLLNVDRYPLGAGVQAELKPLQ
jgi:4-carboxymuconolactone decarboxylase